MAENGAVRMAALGFLVLAPFAIPTKGDVLIGNGAAVAEAIGLIGVAGAS
jgi:hypothetical protein